jgi:hypothetical protein
VPKKPPIIFSYYYPFKAAKLQKKQQTPAVFTNFFHLPQMFLAYRQEAGKVAEVKQNVRCRALQHHVERSERIVSRVVKGLLLRGKVKSTPMIAKSST